ncbi:hypothetical protein Mal33_54030 [Rosistilla oblonga]|uniref:Uncharacterized protein n=1 Tax=Rosistilla oblonga TaxID=2527990 RepID=A0A518J211_9BACT|nr:hypothetical protein Mal33_54030 [Rosistilla oblonga]
MRCVCKLCVGALLWYIDNLGTVVDFIRRFWVFGLILVMVALHALIIVNVRKELVKIKADESQAVDLGRFSFQRVDDKSTVYQVHLYALLEPSQAVRGRQELQKNIATLNEIVGQQLRLAEKNWLADPIQTDLKHHLKQEISKSMNIDFLEQLLVTEWLELPVGIATGTTLSQNQSLASDS